MDFKVAWVLNTCPIYRIMPLSRLEKLLESGENTLFRPSSWDDPYEVIPSNSVYETEHGDISLDTSHWFGQCWSLCEESALMWQSFAPRAKSPDTCKEIKECRNKSQRYVKIKVRVEDLISGLRDYKSDNVRICVVDYIRYFNETITDFEEKITDVITYHGWPKNLALKGIPLNELYPLYPLLTKRKAFKHEEEVRLLIFDKSAKPIDDTISYKFDKKKIEEIILDPWTSEDELSEIKKNLQKNLGDKVFIDKSKLYSDSGKFVIRFK